jgi:hypothetical protein
MVCHCSTIAVLLWPSCIFLLNFAKHIMVIVLYYGKSIFFFSMYDMMMHDTILYVFVNNALSSENYL